MMATLATLLLIAHGRLLVCGTYPSSSRGLCGNDRHGLLSLNTELNQLIAHHLQEKVVIADAVIVIAPIVIGRKQLIEVRAPSPLEQQLPDDSPKDGGRSDEILADKHEMTAGLHNSIDLWEHPHRI